MGANLSESFAGSLNPNSRFFTLITSADGDVASQWAYWINPFIGTEGVPFATPTRGVYVFGGIAELLNSDNADYVMRRDSSDLQSRTTWAGMN